MIYVILNLVKHPKLMATYTAPYYLLPFTTNFYGRAVCTLPNVALDPSTLASPRVLFEKQNFKSHPMHTKPRICILPRYPADV